ncbi:MAG: hypothetical protein WDN06_15675 [Asticcacaulis sp.]
MSRLAIVCFVAVLSVFAVPVYAQDDEDMAYLKKMHDEALQYMAEATAAADAGDEARECEALKQVILSTGSGYMTASVAADDMRDNGESDDQIALMESLAADFLEQKNVVGQMSAGCIPYYQ